MRNFFFQLLITFDFLKAMRDDAFIVKLKKIFLNLSLKHHF